MSRIAFLTESTPQDQNYISQTTYELIRSLKSNQHTVQVFAPFHSTDQFNYDEPFEMSFPTKGWKLWELPFLIPALHKFRPDILHVIQPHQDRFQSFFHLFKILPTLKPLMNNIPIVVSLFNWDSRKLSTQNYATLLNLADLILVPNLVIKNEVSSYLDNIQRHHIEVVPPSLSTFQSESAKMEASWVSDIVDPYFIFAESIDYHGDRFDLFLAALQKVTKGPFHRKFIFYDGWGELGPYQRKKWQLKISNLGLQEDVIIPSDLSPEQKRQLEFNAEGLIALGLPAHGLRFTHLLYASLVYQTPMIMSETQASLQGTHWSKMPHCLFVNDIQRDLPTQLAKWQTNQRFKSDIVTSLQEFVQPTYDASANLVSRLYAELLN